MILKALYTERVAILTADTGVFIRFGDQTFTKNKGYPTFDETDEFVNIIDDRGEQQTLSFDFMFEHFEVV